MSFLSTEWVDYVEEPMKYQALRPQFFSVGKWWLVEWVVEWVRWGGWVFGWGGWVGGGGGGGTHSVDMRPCGCFILYCNFLFNSKNLTIHFGKIMQLVSRKTRKHI